jgi:hypothetical protein
VLILANALTSSEWQIRSRRSPVSPADDLIFRWRRPVFLQYRVISAGDGKNLPPTRVEPNVCFCIIWKPNCAWHGRRSAAMQPTGDLISG